MSAAAPPESIDTCRERWQSAQQRAAALLARLREQQRHHKCVIVVEHCLIFYAITGKWLENCQPTELEWDALVGVVCMRMLRPASGVPVRLLV
jgi:broad specificity phosphatase PhoE